MMQEMQKGGSLGSSWIRTRALIIKELHQIIRDPSSLLISFGLPFILLFLLEIS